MNWLHFCIILNIGILVTKAESKSKIFSNLTPQTSASPTYFLERRLSIPNFSYIPRIYVPTQEPWSIKELKYKIHAFKEEVIKALAELKKADEILEWKIEDAEPEPLIPSKYLYFSLILFIFGRRNR